MTSDKVWLLIQAGLALEDVIVKELSQLKAKGELTPELEAAYQQRQQAVYARPEMQPEAPAPGSPVPPS